MAAGTTECRASARELLPARFYASAGLGGGYWPACLAWSYSLWGKSIVWCRMGDDGCRAHSCQRAGGAHASLYSKYTQMQSIAEHHMAARLQNRRVPDSTSPG
ncbi:hypothetical protein COCMIDRAFT_24438 [Bipolaris oryzae ATCC 44560]|uniref:Uncharacterized protein n=1 Tax=Bipolaris oryzae ATCC 44560 TaxID=930090 RepID=W6ZD51_COCMI|nr:uncharacterized protein COCMIDRAFT_24438 [Bipolaris oryzae ATCC 44560]EUC47733.1 hypothetical protein COCMIDRAFT_24438 [Bipolaris oryzae ATCC 44560]